MWNRQSLVPGLVPIASGHAVSRFQMLGLGLPAHALGYPGTLTSCDP